MKTYTCSVVRSDKMTVTEADWVGDVGFKTGGLTVYLRCGEELDDLIEYLKKQKKKKHKKYLRSQQG